MLRIRFTVKATRVRSVPRPLEQPEAAWSPMSHTGGKRLIVVKSGRPMLAKFDAILRAPPLAAHALWQRAGRA
jgi:hypothetical protein